MANNLLIKKAFVKQILQEEIKRFDTNQTRAIQKLLNFQTGKLEAQRHFNVIGGNVDMDGAMKVSTPAYGRVLDIKPKNRKIQGIRKNKKRRKQFPIYNRFVFGHYYSIASKLNYGLTKEVADNIKKDFEKNNNIQISM